MAEGVIVEALRERFKCLKGLIGLIDPDVAKSLIEMMDALAESIRALEVCYNDLTRDFQRKVNGLEKDLALVKCVIGETSIGADMYAKVKVPKHIGYSEYVRGEQVVQLYVWFANVGKD